MTPSARMRFCESITGPIDPWEYVREIGKSSDIDDYLGALNRYLDAIGVRRFSALEVSTPSASSQAIAKKTDPKESIHNGKFVLVIPVWLWQPLGAVTLLADEIRTAHGAPVVCRNSTRPWWINQHIAASGIASDHPQTAALDLDLSKGGDAEAAHARAEELYDEHARTLEPSLGLGPNVIHFGIHSPHGRRRWRY